MLRAASTNQCQESVLVDDMYALLLGLLDLAGRAVPRINKRGDIFREACTNRSAKCHTCHFGVYSGHGNELAGEQKSLVRQLAAITGKFLGRVHRGGEDIHFPQKRINDLHISCAGGKAQERVNGLGPNSGYEQQTRATTLLETPPQLRIAGMWVLIAPPPTAGVMLGLLPIVILLGLSYAFLKGYQPNPLEENDSAPQFWSDIDKLKLEFKDPVWNPDDMEKGRIGRMGVAFCTISFMAIFIATQVRPDTAPPPRSG